MSGIDVVQSVTAVCEAKHTTRLVAI